ncbi:DUF559 domain-containing protein [Isoptericola sp. 178]|uniref:DUF559 domain-containing protein n=1 Tax=Isoptericola sp. 178 TaxID=3064651 RepID=UPI00271274F5|nr:DUF559 domain-containing protein [Isoptericola sp. 178]MDO8143967.1 DUF559 domain-containing protein [Isoptericola sp. 178]
MLRTTAEGPTREPFRVADALAQGADPAALRRVDLDAPFHGVRAPAASVSDLEGRCRALMAVLDDGVVFSHVTALRLLGVDVPWTLRHEAGDDAPPHVVTSREAGRPQRQDVVAHRSRQELLDTMVVRGLPVTTPAQTFVHVAAGLRVPDDVVVLGDAMMRHRRELVLPAQLADLAGRTRKVKGIAQVRAQVPRVRPGTDSVMETRTRLRLTDAGLPEPLVNATLRLADGTYVKRCDLLYPDHRVIVEYDGDQHRSDRAQWRDDVRRRRWTERLGYTVVVVVGDDFVEALTAGAGSAVDRVRALLAGPVPPQPPRAPRTVAVPYVPSAPPATPLWV